MSLQARYTILRKIADGGTAEIFLAKQHGAHGFEKAVVLKRIFTAFYADPQFRHMLVDEAHIAMTLSHSNIVQVLDLGEVDGATSSRSSSSTGGRSIARSSERRRRACPSRPRSHSTSRPR